MLALMLKAFRKDHDISLRSLAKVIGIRYTTVYRFENGQQIEAKALGKIIQWALSTRII